VALAFSPDGKLLATAGGPPTEEGEVKLIEVASGKVVQDLKGAHSDTAFGVSFSADGKMLATCGADKFVKIFNVADGKFIKSFEGHTHHVLDVGWKSDGKFLASAGADNAIKVWDFEKGEQARTVSGHSKQVTKISFTSTNPQFATTSGDKTLRLWNADNGSAIKTFPAAEEFLYALAVSQDSKLFAAGGDAGNIYLFDDQGKLLKKLDPLSVPKEAPKAPDKK
jgi:WD40 repeat protein